MAVAVPRLEHERVAQAARAAARAAAYAKPAAIECRTLAAALLWTLVVTAVGIGVSIATVVRAYARVVPPLAREGAAAARRTSSRVGHPALYAAGVLVAVCVGLLVGHL
jgi:hypothetical protein